MHCVQAMRPKNRLVDDIAVLLSVVYTAVPLATEWRRKQVFAGTMEWYVLIVMGGDGNEICGAGGNGCNFCSLAGV